jgi:hypothetical protein
MSRPVLSRYLNSRGASVWIRLHVWQHSDYIDAKTEDPCLPDVKIPLFYIKAKPRLSWVV